MNFLRYNNGRNYVPCDLVKYVDIITDEISGEDNKVVLVDVMRIFVKGNAVPYEIEKGNVDFNYNLKIMEAI